MAPRSFLAFFILTSCIVAGQSPKYALKGGKVSLKPDITGQPDGILWKHKGNKVVEFNGKEQHVYNPFDNRITLDWISAELTITDLGFEDSGEYELEVDMNKVLHRSLHKLEVMDKVAVPTISCKMNGGSSSKSGELECSSEFIRPQLLTKFEWSTRGNVQPGPQLTISLGDEHDDEVYSCSVSNPLSRETATFTAKDCYPDESASVALIAGLVSFFVLLLLVGVGVGVWFCKQHHKACFAKGDLEKQSPEDKKKARADINRALLERASTRPSNQQLHQFSKAVDIYKQEEEPLTGRSPDVDIYKQEAEPLTGRSPACVVDEEYKTPQKGHVKDKTKLFEVKLHDGGQTSFKKLQTDKHKRTASPPSPPPSESPSPLDLNNPASNDDGELSKEEIPQYTLSDPEEANEPDPAGVSDKLSKDAQSDTEFTMALEAQEPEKEADDEEKPATPETPPAVQPHSPDTKSFPNMAPEDTGGEHEEDADSSEKNESDDSSEDELSSTIPEQRSSKSDLYSAASQQPQSPTPTKPDNRNADTPQESPHAAHAGPDREEKEEGHKTSRDSYESDGQSDKGEGETDEGKNDIQRGLKEEKPGNESLSENKEGQKEDEDEVVK